MNSKVSIVRCSDYSKAKDSIRKALDLIGDFEKVISPGSRVLLKPNVLFIRPPEDAVTTHPAVVAAMCDLVSEAGGIPVIRDGGRSGSRIYQHLTGFKSIGYRKCCCQPRGRTNKF